MPRNGRIYAWLLAAMTGCALAAHAAQPEIIGEGAKTPAPGTPPDRSPQPYTAPSDPKTAADPGGSKNAEQPHITSGGAVVFLPSPCGPTGANRPYNPGWLPGPNGCPPPPLLYASPRGPWYIVTDAVALTRDTSDERVFATLNTPTDIALETSDLDYPFEGGLRTLIGRQLNDWYAIEGSYFGLTSWDEFRAIRDDTANAAGGVGNLFSPFTNFGAPAGVAGLDFNNFASIRSVSSLDNVEISLRQRVDTPPLPIQVSALYGIRYMNIRERFEYRTESTAPAGGTINFVDVETDNDVIGFQFGLALEARIEPRAWINFEMKGFLANNRADQNTDYTVGPLAGPGVTRSGARAEERTLFAGDASLTFMYQFTRNIVGRIGYQSMWVDGLALASENFQADEDILLLGPAQLSHDGSVVYHGPFAGLLWTW